MILIDTHTHLYLPQFTDDIARVVKNATEKHVAKMLLPNIDCDSVNPMLKLCNLYPLQCYPMLGLHPTSVKEDYRSKLNLLKTHGKIDKFIAIGETGMDAYWDTTFLREQEDAFIIQIGWAKTMNLPIIIHSRNTMDNILQILKPHKNKDLKGVFHAYSGTMEQAMEAVNMGFKLGIGGVVTFKNAVLTKVIESVSLENIVLETDSPYLTPVPKRGKRNESANLIFIAEKIAELKGVPVEEVARVTTRNAAEIFNLKPE